MTMRLWAPLLLALLANPAPAIVVDTLNGSNEALPPDDPGFRNVSTCKSGCDPSTFVYLGNGWVATAGHVGAQAVTFNGTDYASNGISVTFTYPDSTAADFVVFNIAPPYPNLPSLRLRATDPVAGDAVVMVGHGFGPATSDSGTGWNYTSIRVMRWGTNNIATVGNTITTVFNSGISANEAQATTNDSGAAMFIKNATTGYWELAGIVTNGSTTGSVVYGVSTTTAVNISALRPKILIGMRKFGFVNGILNGGVR